MWSYEKGATAQVSRAIVWEWWTNVEKWPQWDTDLSESALLGELAVGVQGKMKVADDALISFTVTEVIPEERLVIKVSLFGATLFYTHTMTEEDGQLRIVHGASIRGLFGFFWRLLLRKKIEKTLLPALEALVAQVVAESARRAEIAAAAAPVPESVADAAADAGPAVSQLPVTGAESEQKEPVKTEAVVGGDPLENELRAKDIHTQIEMAAQAPENVPTVPEGDQHTAVIPVSPVITKKETKRKA